jgi:hypothetical protein
MVALLSGEVMFVDHVPQFARKTEEGSRSHGVEGASSEGVSVLGDLVESESGGSRDMESLAK